MKSDSDIYIDILKYGRDNPGFTLKDISGRFPTHAQLIWNEMHNSHLFLPIAADENIFEGELALSFEDRFRLLEYEELQEARQSSRRAMGIAIISIILSVVVTVISFFTVQNVEIVKRSEPQHQEMLIQPKDTTK